MSYITDYDASRSHGSKRYGDIDIEDFHKDWYPVFQRFNPDKNGEIKLKEMRRLLSVLGEMHRIMPEEAVEEILSRADKDSNGKFSYTEFLDMIIGHEFHHEHRQIIRSSIRAAAFAVVPRNERTYVSQYSCNPPPLFMITISVIEIAVFIYETLNLISKGKSIGFQGPLDFDSVLIYNPRRRHEAWRFISYMLVHAGLMHITFNIIMQLLIGIPLEMVHKWWRVMIVYFVGVIAGSLGTSLTDPKVFLCGASGGVYALIFAHLASVILNWQEMEFAWIRLLSFGVLISVDVGSAIYERYIQQQESKIGYVAHIAGAIAGLLIGINVLRNLRKRTWEKVVWWMSLTAFVILVIFAITWNIMDPRKQFLS